MCVYMYVHVHRQVYIYACTHIPMYVSIHVCMYIHMCMYMAILTTIWFIIEISINNTYTIMIKRKHYPSCSLWSVMTECNRRILTAKIYFQLVPVLDIRNCAIWGWLVTMRSINIYKHLTHAAHELKVACIARVAHVEVARIARVPHVYIAANLHLDTVTS